MAVEYLSTFGTNSQALPSSWSSSSGGGSGTINIQGNAFRIVTPATGGYNGSGRIWYGRPYWNIDFLVRITPGAAWTTESFIAIGIGDVFNLATNEPDNCWNVSLGPQANQFVTHHVVAQVDTDLLTPGYTFTGSNAVWVRFRKFGYTIYGKIWDDTAGTVEPSAWTAAAFLDTTGPNTVAPMYPFLSVNTGSAATAITHSFDRIRLDDLQPIAVTMAPTVPVSTDNLLNPALDVSNAGLWTTNTGATTGLYQAIDEDTFDDADYIQSPAGP